jgi:hypothetical protein
MPVIKARFDGRVFVPDEPVPLRLGEPVVVQPAATIETGQTRPPDVSVLRKLDIDLDQRSLREIIDDPELRIENF